MKILVHISHPAQFHLYKNAIRNWKDDGNEVFVIIKTKDILEDLLNEAGIQYYNVLPVAHRKSKIGLLWDLLVRDWRIMRFAQKHEIDMLTGSSVEVAHVSWILHKYSVNTGEDDMAVVPAFEKAVGPTMQTILSPVTCNNGKFEPKSIHYEGFHKLAYLHPNQFMPDKKVVEKYFNPNKPYFLLRFAELKAYHDLDASVHGINTAIAQKLVDILKPHGDIYITSERQLEPQFEQFRLHINPLDIHHIMAFAKIYVGDSQSMAVEAAMLGTPSVRFNDFAGKIGVLEELQQKYRLTIGIPCSDQGRLYDTVKTLLSMPNLREEFQQRRQKLLADKIDVTAFFTWFIENYPESKRIMKENPDYQYRFK